MSVQTMHRNMDLGEMVQALKNQQAVKNDVIVSADKLAVIREGRELPYLVVNNAEPQINENGVTQVDGYYNLSDRFLATVAVGSTRPRPTLGATLGSDKTAHTAWQ